MALPKVSDSLNINSFKNAISFYEILYNQLKNGVFVEISRDDIIKSQNGRDYRQHAAPLFSQLAPTFDVPSVNEVSQTQPITQPIIQEPAITTIQEPTPSPAPIQEPTPSPAPIQEPTPSPQPDSYQNAPVPESDEDKKSESFKNNITKIIITYTRVVTSTN